MMSFDLVMIMSGGGCHAVFLLLLRCAALCCLLSPLDLQATSVLVCIKASKTHHDDVVPKPRLCLPNGRAARRARLEPERDLLKLWVQAAAGLPSQRAALPRLVLGELARHLVKLDAVADLGQGLFLLGVLLALRGAVSPRFGTIDGWGTGCSPECASR